MKIFVKNENVVMVIFIFFFFLFNGVGNIKAETTTNAKILTSFSIFNGNYTAVEFISSQDGISKGISSTIPGKARWVAVTAYQYQYAINPNMPPTRLEVQEYVYKKNNTLSTVTNKNDIPTDADWVTATKLDLGDYIYSTNQNFNYSLDGTSILQGNLIPINAVWASLREVNAYGSWTNNTNYSNYEHIFLDTTPPTGSLTINDGASFTTSYNVTLKISQSDTGGSGDVQMQFSNDNGTWSGWENASLTKSWTLTSGDGQKTVFVKFRDAAGNETPVISNTINVDSTPPTGSLTINDGASFTASSNVTLNITQSDTGGSDDVQMQFSNDNGTWSEWENASLTKPWTLENGDGEKTVYVKLKDAAGNETPVISNTINVDSTPPTGSLTINDGASFTASSNVTLNITQSDTGGSGDVQMQFSNDNGTWSEWENVAVTKPWTLENGDGEKTVYVKLKDAVGNTFVISNKIVLKIPSSNTNLNEISLSNGTLDPAFSSALSNYTASVSNDVSWIKVTPTLEDNKATVTVNGTIVENSNSSDIINLNIGSNIIIIVVTAEDSSTKTYSITVKRPPAKPSVSADDTSNIIIGINETMEYQIGTGLWTTYDSNIPPDLSGNNKVKVRVKAIGEVPSGEDITLMFTHNPPEAPNVTADDINNKFQGANNTMEYSTDNGSTWKPYDPSNEPTFTGNLTVFVRIKAQGEIPYGASTSVHFTTNPPSGGYNGGGGNIPDPTPNPEPIIQAPEQVKTLMKDGKLQIKVKDPKTGELIEAKIESIQSIGGFFIVQIGEKGEISKGVELPQGEAKVVILDNEKPYSYFDIGIDTSPTKEWKVQFSAPLLDEIENLNNITVQDALGQKIDIKISLSKDGKAVNIIPNIPYKKDELYYITIVDSIGVNGQKQKDPIRKIFIIE
ncbi:DUF4073 domain-containing protein [Lysinibacillus antri]|uniref:DUF4073 domain-containing protein n=1 Tax=Lysinibacillus antri TaxID=2498145 RepID=A0A432L9H4_9BACI|nr:DUF4073 domain-containing protein [Lysinibacillus antri]RUL50463.1 DUF4073 domain-containing protein [Lysinibacillus antri]